MKKCMLDTNIISAILKGNMQVITFAEKYLQNQEAFVLSAITYYEITRGLLLLKNQRKMDAFMEFISTCILIFPDKTIFDRAANIYVDLADEGNLIEDADILIAATALENDLILVTDNEKHFSRIKGLIIENWVRTS